MAHRKAGEKTARPDGTPHSAGPRETTNSRTAKSRCHSSSIADSADRKRWLPGETFHREAVPTGATETRRPLRPALPAPQETPRWLRKRQLQPRTARPQFPGLAGARLE